MSIKYGLKLLFTAKMTIELNSSIFSSIKKYDPLDTEQVMISVTDVRKAGDHHLMQGQNPVWIFSFTL